MSVKRSTDRARIVGAGGYLQVRERFPTGTEGLIGKMERWWKDQTAYEGCLLCRCVCRGGTGLAFDGHAGAGRGVAAAGGARGR